MSFITWTKSWKKTDDITTFGGADLGAVQNDITDVLDTSLTNVNVSNRGKVDESKISFDISAGHRHTGSDSRLIGNFTNLVDKHGREGMTISASAADTVSIAAGSLVINGAILTQTSASTVTNTAADVASTYVYVYTRDNSGSFAFSVSHLAPNIIDADQNNSGSVFRYRMFDVSGTSTPHRCLGAIFNDSSQDLQTETSTSFDVSGVQVVETDTSINDNASFVFETIWTPKYVVSYVQTSITINTATKTFMDTTNLQMKGGRGFFVREDPTSDIGVVINDITAQSSACTGSVTVTNKTGISQVITLIAMTDLVGRSGL